MDAIPTLIFNLERQFVQIICSRNKKIVSVDDFFFLHFSGKETSEEFSDDEQYSESIRKLYQASIRNFNQGIKDRSTLEDRRIFITEVVRSFRNALKSFDKKILFDPEIDATRYVMVSSKLAENYPIENGIELSNAEVQLLAEPFISILHDYGTRFLEHVLNFRELFPDAIENGSQEKALEMPKLYWKKGKPGALVEVLWTLVEAGYIYKDKTCTNKAEMKMLMSFFSSVFNINLENYDDLMKSAYRRDSSKSSFDTLKKLHDVFKEKQDIFQKSDPKG